MRKKDRNKIVEPDYTIYEVKPHKDDERNLSPKRMERRGLVSENGSKKKKEGFFNFVFVILILLFVLGMITWVVFLFVNPDWRDSKAALHLFFFFLAFIVLIGLRWWFSHDWI